MPWVSLLTSVLLGCNLEAGSKLANGHDTSFNSRTSAPPPRNILLIVSDDVGTDQSACYTRPAATRAPQPNIQRLCDNGIAFDRAWSSPYCSPTRAGLFTGRHASRTGVGSPLNTGAPGPSLDELGLPEILGQDELGYATGAFGKWHLADPDNGLQNHPNLIGFDQYAGAIKGHLEDYYEWERVENGVESTVTDYATTRTVDDALDWLDEQDGPWFAYVSFHAPHFPLHLPPADLHSYDHLTGDYEDITDRPEEYYQAMLEAVDTEIGRLLDSMDSATRANTVIIYMADNGTEARVNQSTYIPSKAKGSLYQGGVHVPLIVGGAGLLGGGRRVNHPVHTLDLFSTIIELAGGTTDDLIPTETTIDAVSMMPYLVNPSAPRLRATVVSEVFGALVPEDESGQTVSDGRFKLVQLLSGEEYFFDLAGDSSESTDLLDVGFPTIRARELYHEFSEELDELPLD